MATRPKTKSTRIHRKDLARFIPDIATIKEFENLNQDVSETLPDEILIAQQAAEAALLGSGLKQTQPGLVTRDEVAAMIDLATGSINSNPDVWQSAWLAQLLARQSQQSAGTSVTPPAGQIYTRGACWLGGGIPIVLPTDKVVIACPVSGTITKAEVLTEGGTGSCVIDVWKDTYANFPPTVGDSICGASKPTISSGIKYVNTALTGWTTSITAGDVLRFNLDSVSVFSSITIILEITP